MVLFHTSLKFHETGLPEFDVPSLHNLLVPHATISPGNGPLDIVLKFRNANVAGLDDLVIDKIS